MIAASMLPEGAFSEPPRERVLPEEAYEMPSPGALASMVSEIIGEGLLVLNEDLTIERVNTAFSESFGVEASDLVGHHLYDAMGGQWNIPPVRELLEEALGETRIATGVEIEREFDGGEPRRLLINARRFEEQPLVLFVVDDREEEDVPVFPLRHRKLDPSQEELLDRVLRNLPDIVTIHYVPTHGNVWCNDRIIDVLGYRPEEVYAFGSALLPFLIHPADLERVHAFYSDYEREQAQDQVRQITCRMMRRDGRYRWMATRESVLQRAEDGRVIQVLIVARDVTPLYEKEKDLRGLSATLEEQVEERTAALKESEERFRALVEASAQIVWTTDPAGAAVDVSPSWGAFTGQTFEEGKGWGWLEMVHPEDRDYVRTIWKESVETETPVDAEFRLYHVDSDAWRWMHVRAVPLRREDGSVRGWVGMNTDIDKRRRAEEEQRRLNRMLQEQAEQIQALASQLTMAEQQERRRVAHILHDDLQQRLFGVQMKMRGIRKHAEAGERERLLESLEEVESWLRRSVAITRQLTVDLSPPVLREDGLADALRWLISQMEDMHGLKVELKAEHAFRMKNEDMRVLLFQTVRELLFNVVKHAEVDRATVELHEVDDEIVIHVVDEGQGFKVENIAAPESHQTGFGLVNARERIRLFGGDLEVTSQRGQGTRVTLRVPVELTP